MKLVDKKKIKKVGSFAVDGLFGLIAICCLVCVIGYFCGLRSYITLSGSMEPVIQTGSICVVNTNASYEDIEVGDVIAFKSLSSRVTHRVIAITEDGIETKGDNNDISDGITTTIENFEGKTIFSIPYLGYVMSDLQKPYVIAIIIIFIMVLIEINIAKKTYQKWEEENK